MMKSKCTCLDESCINNYYSEITKTTTIKLTVIFMGGKVGGTRTNSTFTIFSSNKKLIDNRSTNVIIPTTR